MNEFKFLVLLIKQKAVFFSSSIIFQRDKELLGLANSVTEALWNEGYNNVDIPKL